MESKLQKFCQEEIHKNKPFSKWLKTFKTREDRYMIGWHLCRHFYTTNARASIPPRGIKKSHNWQLFQHFEGKITRTLKDIKNNKETWHLTWKQRSQIAKCAVKVTNSIKKYQFTIFAAFSFEYGCYLCIGNLKEFVVGLGTLMPPSDKEPALRRI